MRSVLIFFDCLTVGLIFVLLLTHSLVSHPIFRLSWVTSTDLVTRSVVSELLFFYLGLETFLQMHTAPVYTKQFRLHRVWSPFSHSSAMKLSTCVKQASSTTLPLHDCSVRVSRQPTPSFWTSLSMVQYSSRSFSGRTETGWVGC